MLAANMTPLPRVWAAELLQMCGGISRRFDSQLLLALYQAYGLRPEGYARVPLPEAFSAKLELLGRVDTAPELMFGARLLLSQMSGWLHRPPTWSNGIHPALLP